MCDEKNVCILHRCSKAIVNIYIYIHLKKICCVCKHIHLTLVGMYTYYNTYTHCISNVDQKIILKKNCILQVDVCEYRIIFGVCVLLVCLVC